MKENYPSFRQMNGTSSIEESLSQGDKKTLTDFLRYCAVSAGKERVEGKIKPILLQIRSIIEKDFDKWTLEDIQDITRIINQSDKAEWTKNDLKATLKRFIKWFYKKEEMYSFIKRKSDLDSFNYQKVNENTLISELEFEKMLRSANTLKQKAILSLLFESAIRPQELRNLKWGDIKIDDEIGVVCVYSGKTRKSRTVFIKDSNIHLKRWKQEFEFPDLRNDDYIFPNPKNRKQLSNNALPVMFKRLSIKAGLGRNVFPYLCRHTRISQLNQTLPAHIESKIAGHSLKQSQIYTHLSTDDVRRAMMDNIFKVKEISSERKHVLELEIEELKKEMKLRELEEQNFNLKLFEEFKKIQKQIDDIKELKKKGLIVIKG